MIEEQKRKEELENMRRERRKMIRDQDIPESQLCVVCRSNPREVKRQLFTKHNVFIVFFLR